MIARRDVVRCFSCHVVLQDWERNDIVIEEHQRHSPNCQYLKLLNKDRLDTPHGLGPVTTSTQLSTDLRQGKTTNLRVQAEKGTFQSSLNPQESICPSDSNDNSDEKRLTDILGNRVDPSNIWKVGVIMIMYTSIYLWYTLLQPSRDDVRNFDVERCQLSTLPKRMVSFSVYSECFVVFCYKVSWSHSTQQYYH